MFNFTPASKSIAVNAMIFDKGKRILVLHDIIAFSFLRGQLNLYSSVVNNDNDIIAIINSSYNYKQYCAFNIVCKYLLKNTSTNI